MFLLVLNKVPFTSKAKPKGTFLNKDVNQLMVLHNRLTLSVFKSTAQPDL